jgi:hypothetical protein
MSLLPAGSPAPDFSLTAVTSERQINPHNMPGRLLLMFHGYQTAVLVGSVVQALKEDYPDPEQLGMVSVVDLRAIPRLLHGVANKIMHDAYQQAAGQVPDGQNAADHIVILPDWKGVAFEAYQVPKSNDQVALVLIDEEHLIQGSYLGDEPLQGALALLGVE